MITPGRSLDDHLLSVAHGFEKNVLSRESGIECEASILFSSAFIEARDWLDETAPGRPYMHMIGECLNLRGKLPYGVTGLRFPEKRGLPVDVFYEFTNEQIQDLVGKGLYEPGFSCPFVLTDGRSLIDMPVYVDIAAIQPESEGDVPVLFAAIEYPHSISMTMEDCGYDFAQLFTEAYVQEQTNLFSDDIFDFDEASNMFKDDVKESSEDDKSAETFVEEEESDEVRTLRDRYKDIHERVETNISQRRHLMRQHDAKFFDKQDEMSDGLTAGIPTAEPEKAPMIDELGNLSSGQGPGLWQYVNDVQEDAPEEDSDPMFDFDDALDDEDVIEDEQSESESIYQAKHVQVVEHQNDAIAESYGDIDHDGDVDEHDAEIGGEPKHLSDEHVEPKQVPSYFEDVVSQSDESEEEQERDDM